MNRPMLTAGSDSSKPWTSAPAPSLPASSSLCVESANSTSAAKDNSPKVGPLSCLVLILKPDSELEAQFHTNATPWTGMVKGTAKLWSRNYFLQVLFIKQV